MSFFQNINELRKAGKLEEAYALGRQALAQDRSVWHQRAMSWVLYGLLKKAVAEQQGEAATEYLEEIRQLGLPADETMFWEKIPWLLGKLIYDLPEPFWPAATLQRFFDLLRELPVRTPGEGYSYLLRAYLHKGKGWGGLLDFLDWWGLDAFSPKDYEPRTLSNGKRGLALVEQALIAYAKGLLGEPGEGASVPASERTEAFLAVLQQVGTAHPEFRYVPYYLAQLFMAQGRDDEAIRAFLPFARHKKGEYWIWELMADLFRSDTALQFACLCKALDCRMEDPFSVKLRRKVVPLLLERGESAQAAAQVHRLKAIYVREAWKLPGEVLLWSLMPWAKEHSAAKEDRALFRAHSREAESLLYADIPEVRIIVSAVFRQKGWVYYVSEEGRPGSFRCAAGEALPEVGAAFRARLLEETGQTHAFALQPLPKEEVPETLRKRFSGVLRRIPGQAFAFVDDVFLPPALVEAYALAPGQYQSGWAVRSWDKHKERLGWQAESLDDTPRGAI
jgi:hypothetical protein